MPRKYPISRSKDHQFTVNDLITARSELAGEREKALKRISEIETSITQLDGALRLFGFDDFRSLAPIHRLKPVRITRIEGRARQAALWKFLQDHPEGKTTVEIADLLIEHFDLDRDNRHEMTATRNYIRKVLNRWQAEGSVEVCDYTGQSKRWKILSKLAPGRSGGN
ncbi:MAG: hypothetical protein KDJ63_07480 [Nitratireductor sp.]|nr:hypothetical protein [Nitratireductor sp.]